MEVDQENVKKEKKRRRRVERLRKIMKKKEVNYDDSLSMHSIRGCYSAIIFGSTGSLGRGVLKALKTSQKCEKILAITRRRIETHPKLTNLIWEDFDDYLLFETESTNSNEEEEEEGEEEVKKEVPQKLVELFQGYDVCFNNCGISGNKVNYDQYLKLLHTYATRLAHICAESNVGYYYYTSTFESSYMLFHYVRSGCVQHITEEYIKNEKRITDRLTHVTFIKPPAIISDHSEEWMKECCIRCWLGPIITLFCTKNYLIKRSVYGRGIVKHFERKFYYINSRKEGEGEDEKKKEFSWDELWADGIVKFAEY